MLSYISPTVFLVEVCTHKKQACSGSLSPSVFLLRKALKDFPTSSCTTRGYKLKKKPKQTKGIHASPFFIPSSMSLRNFSPCTLFAHKVPVANPLTTEVELKTKRAQNFSSDSLLNISSKEHTAHKHFPMPPANKQYHIRCKI